MSKKEIRPGMLCFLTRCVGRRLEVNNGVPVTVLESARVRGFEGWIVTSGQDLVAIVSINGDRLTFGPVKRAFALSKQLIPIDADPKGEWDESMSWLPPVPRTMATN